MIEIPADIYTKNFSAIFNRFHDYVHLGPENFRYDVIDLDNTHLKMCDLVNEATGRVTFRVILKATYQDVENAPIPRKNHRDIIQLFNTKSNAELANTTATQVCYIQLNDANKPVHGVLFTYSPHDEQFHQFKLPKE